MVFKTDNTKPGTWTDEAAAKIGGSIGRVLKAMADGDDAAFKAESAKARALMNDPNSKHK
jgi:hypothetical protein